MAAEHKEGCWYPRAITEERRYYNNWPNACTRCEGWGGFPWYDNDTGHQDYDPCPECLEKGKCSRCGGGIIAEAYWDVGHYAQCDNCSFMEGKTPGTPPKELCSCVEPSPELDEDYLAFIEEVQVCGVCKRTVPVDTKGICNFCVDRDLPEDHYPYELSDHLYDVYRERGRF